MNRFNKKTNFSLNKKCIFITGCPRSGTSMLTKIIDSHPEISILMENIFANRRRHWEKADYWYDNRQFKRELNSIYSKVKEPIVGNKVITPDVWSLDDLLQFCMAFNEFKIIWIIRNPRDVLFSRLNREKPNHFNDMARKWLPLDYSSKFNTWTSSWRQSIENYRRMKEFLPLNTELVYYDDLVENFEKYIIHIFQKLEIPFNDRVLLWHEVAHTNHNGIKKKDLKYQDSDVKKKESNIDEDTLLEINMSLKKVSYWINLWENRAI